MKPIDTDPEAKGATAEMDDEQVMDLWARMPAWLKADLLAKGTRKAGGNRAQRRAQVRVKPETKPAHRGRTTERSKG